VVPGGGRRITSPWTNCGKGVWYVDLPGIGLDPSQCNFRQLFVNGVRAIRKKQIPSNCRKG